MRAQPQNQLPKKAVTVWRLYGFFQTMILALLAAGAVFLTIKFNWPVWIQWLMIAIVVLSIICSIIIFPNIRWKIWRYEVREQEIEIQSGLFIVTRTLIPMVRVQHVDTEQGPILKKYNLANISISSAATVHTIPMLELEYADMLRMKISELARVADDDV
ncbi:PH domain-containing protein [Solibacillus sp. MA9]|uniref:PH domain-containing protein n=1 Tax=Solibacillus palustris TaxID=2908203 RepID=A0ABS9UGZ4_9BACL|nr:PH domain-containing protein [Solibacillus sp. MA9]MCH7323639.1 PH domain-containing protein [Solibacillus sp. MA9]